VPVFEWRSIMPVKADELYAWHARPGAFERLTAPWQRVRVVERADGLADGARIAFEYTAGPLHGRWVATHEAVSPGRAFTDLQLSGPFAAWRHEHRFIARIGDQSLMEDHVEYRLPLGTTGALLGEARARNELERLFTFRHERLRNDLLRHRRHRDAPRLKVAISGASGTIGSQLAAFLTTGGHEVLRLVRRAPAAADEVRWDPARGEIEADRLEGVDAVVNLAGETIGQRWTPTAMRAIKASREHGTSLLAATLAGLKRPPKVMISPSAVGYYGASLSDTVFSEEDPSGDDFLAEVCVAWEDAARPAREAGIRVVTPRFGVVMSGREGALARQLLPARLALGGPIGSGDQWWTWIAPDDLLAAVHELLYDDRMTGPVNAVSPEPVTNREFARTLGRVLHRPALLPLPAPVVRGMFGQMGETMLLAGQRVAPRRLTAAGFEWFYPHLEEALRFELGQTKRVMSSPGAAGSAA
jgi:uncharacterized protein (TIGR01777 family)